MAHVLMGFAEALAAPEAFFSLYHAGHRVSVFARTGAAGPMLRHLPLASTHFLPSPEINAPEAVGALARILDEIAPDAVLPLDDTGLWLADRVLGDDRRLAGGRSDAAAVALDKARQIRAAREAGFDLPDTLMVCEPDDLDAAMAFPAIAKPARAVGVTNDGMCLTKGDATWLQDQAAAQALKTTLSPKMAPLLVQPLIGGTGEGIFGFVGTNGVSHLSAHRRLRMMNPHGSGSSACMAIAPDPVLINPVTRFVTAIGWRGPFMVELLRGTDGRPWFMELNGRMWGSMALARAQGFEYPAWAVAQVLDSNFVPPPVTPPAEPITARHLGRDLLHLAFVLRGPKGDFHRQDWPRLLPSLTAVLRPTSYTYNADPAFPGFAWREALYTLRGFLRR